MLLRHVMRLDLRGLPEGWAEAPGPPGVLGLYAGLGFEVVESLTVR